jgi:hypothetical protein
MKMAWMHRINGKRYSRFLVKLFLFLIIVFLLDIGIGSILKHLYYKQDSGLLYRTTYAIDSTQADVLIFGASRANHHYYPGAFEKALHMSCYNAGRDGSAIFYHYAILQGVLKRYSPKMAILDFSNRGFIKDQESYDRISSLLPYYKKHPEMRCIIDLKSPYEKYKLLSKIYPYNSLLFTIAVGNAGFNRGREYNNDEHGYVPLTETWKGGIITDTGFAKYELDSTKIRIFESFVRDCVNANVQLYIILSPYFIKYKFEDRSVVIAKEIAQKYNIPFYDFSQDTVFLNVAELFTDESHLNGGGAKIFSNKIVDRIIRDQPRTPMNENQDSSFR